MGGSVGDMFGFPSLSFGFGPSFGFVFSFYLLFSSLFVLGAPRVLGHGADSLDKLDGG